MSKAQLERTGFSFIADALSWRRLLTQDPNVEDEVRGQAQSLYIFALAAVLVGGVQTQALTYIFGDSTTRLSVAINVLSFISIVSSIIGAFYALLATSTLEANLNQVKSLLGSKSNEELLDIARLPLSSLARRFVYRHCTDRRLIVTNDGQVSSRLREDMLAGTTLEDLCSSIARNKVAGTLGVMVISLGFITCLASFICLACATQSRAVWITTVTVVSVLFAMRVVVQCMPVSYFQRGGRPRYAV